MALRKDWNFHNDIALNLEHIADKTLHLHANNERNTIFSADQIARNSFVEVMILLLRAKSRYEVETSANIEQFIEKAKPYMNLGSILIPEEDASSLYNEFALLISKF